MPGALKCRQNHGFVGADWWVRAASVIESSFRCGIPDTLRFHVGGVYCGVRCDERGGKVGNESARHCAAKWILTRFSASIECPERTREGGSEGGIGHAE